MDNFLKIFCSITLFVCTLSARAETFVNTSEIVNLTAANDYLLINIAKKYPELKFQSFPFQDPPKILIELLDTNYHPNFVFNEKMKEELLKGLSFIENVSVGVAKHNTNSLKVGITLDLKEDFEKELTPKLLSTKENIVKLSFIPIEKEQPLKNSRLLEMYNNAVLEQTKGGGDNAEEIYKQILSVDNDFYVAKYNLAKLYIDKENYSDATNLLLDLINNLSTNPENLAYLNQTKNTLGLVFYLSKNYDKALAQFNEIITSDPLFDEAYYNTGLVYERIKELEQAKANFKKVIEINKSQTVVGKASYHLAVLSLLTKSKNDAIAYFKKVIELIPATTFANLSQNELQKLTKKSFEFFK